MDHLSTQKAAAQKDSSAAQKAAPQPAKAGGQESGAKKPVPEGQIIPKAETVTASQANNPDLRQRKTPAVPSSPTGYGLILFPGLSCGVFHQWGYFSAWNELLTYDLSLLPVNVNKPMNDRLNINKIERKRNCSNTGWMVIIDIV